MNNSPDYQALEIKIAYLEQSNDELSDGLYQANQRIDLLIREIILLKQQMQGAGLDQGGEISQAEAPPPHY